MKTYQLHFRDETGGVRRTLTLKMETDDGAQKLARTLENEHGIEVWLASRRIAVVDPDGKVNRV